MIRRIVTDTAFLSQRSEPAAPFDRTVGQDLLDTLRANQDRCVGLAANMIGANKRVIAVSDEGRLQVFYNPEITRSSRPYETEEGCLSLPGTRRVTRYACIRLHWQDEQGDAARTGLPGPDRADHTARVRPLRGDTGLIAQENDGEASFRGGLPLLCLRDIRQARFQAMAESA